MRFTLLASLVGVLAGLAGGGRVRNLGRASFRALPLLGLGLGGLLAVAAGPPEHGHAVVVGATGALAVFAVANVVRFPGMWLVGVGLLLNLVVVAVNGGMPYRPSALDAAGIERPATAERLPRSVLHHPAGPDDRLLVLAETIPIPPLREVLSPGDLAIGVGAASVLTNALVRARRRDTPRHVRRRRRRSRPAHAGAAPGGPAGGPVGEPVGGPAVVVDVTRAEAVVDLTAGSEAAPPGEEFWRTRAALLGEDPDAEGATGTSPGDLFWQVRDLVEARSPDGGAGGGRRPE